METAAIIQDPKQILSHFFGYEQFRPQQEEIIQSICAGRDTLVLMPTGGGKSLCYQIPAIHLPGMCIVVSPLIALMRDQVRSLVANGVRAAYLNSSQQGQEQYQVEQAALNGELDLLYVSPEKMLSAAFSSVIKNIKLSFIAIDEAHCISQWGHDFRPEYAQIGALREHLMQVPFVALTATADPLTRRDIVQRLGLQSPAEFITSFDRPNLNLEVRPGQKRAEQIIDFIAQRPEQSGIVYCLSRKGCEGLSARLEKAGIKASYYHAGLSAEARSQVQDDFINDKIPVICATIAFGMGIDKSNIRWVMHYNLPKNIEGYYQEIGRAGRDGAPADTLLFYSYADVMTLQQMLDEGQNKAVQLEKLERMQQYADAPNCRRRLLLAYFGEEVDKDCGHCDVCRNPPVKVDATVLAQKALSTVVRTRQSVGIGMLVDILRGSARKDLLDQGFDQLSTYGIGRDVSAYDWQQYLLQMLNMGLVHMALDRGKSLLLTEAGKNVLQGKQSVRLAKVVSFKERKAAQQVRKSKSKTELYQDALFDQLRTLRMDIAQRDDIAPYMVFNDKTLRAMASERPTTPHEMRHVEGVGDRKMQLYGEAFIDSILRYVQENAKGNTSVRGTTYLATYECYRKGMSPEEIAQERRIQVTTIYSHLSRLMESHDIDIYRLLEHWELEQIESAIDRMGDKPTLKGIFNLMDGEMDYGKIRVAMTYLGKK